MFTLSIRWIDCKYWSFSFFLLLFGPKGMVARGFSLPQMLYQPRFVVLAYIYFREVHHNSEL